MARKTPHTIAYRLTKFETIAGWLYLPFYLIILNVLLQLANEKLSLGMTSITINIVYFSVNLAAVLLIFRGFLELCAVAGPGVCTLLCRHVGFAVCAHKARARVHDL